VTISNWLDETAWDAVLEKYKIDTVLWVKAHEELRRFLVEKRAWKEAYAGLYASIYVKPQHSIVLLRPVSHAMQ